MASAAAGTAAVGLNFDMTAYKLQAYTAAAAPGLAVALAEGNASLSVANLIFRFVAFCN
jgi:hypothetical protein